MEDELNINMFPWKIRLNFGGLGETHGTDANKCYYTNYH